jgi:serine/threonine-protein kinase
MPSVQSAGEERAAGKYRILEKIAAGGMGEVYRATMESLGGVDKPVALKLVKQNLANDSDFAALFVEEAKVAMSLSHANVVQSFDVGKIDDRWFLAMEYVDGVDLSGLLQLCHHHLKQPIPHRHVISIAVEALKGLDYAHRRRGANGEPLDIVHRDVSPGNLLISYEGEVKVADFGIAKSALRAVGSLAGTVKGKLPYMAPEQLRGQPVDRRADLYSLGAVLFEMLTMQRVVSDEEGTRAIPKVLTGEFPMPSAIVDSIPEELERIVLKALATEPADRYPNAAAMRQDLERLALAESYLLSSADLADFLAEVLDRDERDTHHTLKPGAVAERRRLAAEAATAAADARASRPADPFDALLGRELMGVRTSGGFSVFTTGAGGGRLRTSPTPNPSSATPDDASTSHKRTAKLAEGIPRESGPQTTPQWTAVKEAERPSPSRGASGPPAGRLETDPPVLPQRRVPIAAILTVAILALLALGAWGLFGRGDGDLPRRDPTTTEPRAAGPAPAVPSEERDGTDPAVVADLPTGVDPPPDLLAPGPSSPAPRPRTTKGAMAPTMAVAAAPSSGNTRLSVNTDPWSYVYLDGRRLGATPQIGTPVTPGRHTIRLENPSEDLERTVHVDVREGQHERLSLDLRP